MIRFKWPLIEMKSLIPTKPSCWLLALVWSFHNHSNFLIQLRSWRWKRFCHRIPARQAQQKFQIHAQFQLKIHPFQIFWGKLWRPKLSPLWYEWFYCFDWFVWIFYNSANYLGYPSIASWIVVHHDVSYKHNDKCLHPIYSVIW